MENSIDIDEAAKIIRGGFGKTLLTIATRYIALIYWYTEKSDGSFNISNGTTFFLNTGEKSFRITAYHVYKAYIEALDSDQKTICQIANLAFIPETHVIDYCEHLDIMTFETDLDEVQKIGKRFFEGHQSSWPPKPPDLGKGVFWAGYPGHERILSNINEINFGIFSALCIAKSVREDNIIIQFEREHFIDQPDMMPQGYALGGISGAPLITLVQTPIFYWRLGGVIYEANEKLGLVYAKHADYILPNGMILKDRQ